MDFVPDAGHFLSPPPPLGSGSFTVSIAGMAVRFNGLAEGFVGDARRRYALFLSAQDPHHEVTVRPGAPGYLDPAEDGYLRLEEAGGEEGRILLSHDLAALATPDGGRGDLRVSTPGDFGSLQRALENYLRWIVADLALRRGGFVLHSSGLVRDRRAHVFFGPSGAGKSTVASLSPGCPLLSDDLVLLLRERDGWKAATTPFCGSLEQESKERGVYPLAGLYRLVQSAGAELLPVPPAVRVGMVLACCPFVGNAAVRQGRLLPLVEDCTRAVPVRELRFRKDPSFWDVIRREDPNG